MRDGINYQRNRSDPEWLRDQIDDLAGHFELASFPPDAQRTREYLQAIRRGEPWRLCAIRKQELQRTGGRRR